VDIDIRLEGTDIHFSEPGVACRLLQHCTTRGHTLKRAFVPHPKMGRDGNANEAFASHRLRASREYLSEGLASELPSSRHWTLEHPSHHLCTMNGLETPFALRETAEIRFRRRPAKDDDFQRIEVLSTYFGTPRAPPASRLRLAFVPVGPPLPHAAAHFRELGIAPESPRLLFPPHRRLALTGQAPRDGSIGTYQRAFAPVAHALA
jgi:hypothetical protein